MDEDDSQNEAVLWQQFSH